MQIVKENFTELGTEIFRISGKISNNEICILDKQTNKFYARSHKYTYFSKCEVIDRFLDWIEFDIKTKTLKIK